MKYVYFGHDLIKMASPLKLPVHIHNIEAERILHPSSWNMFGADHPEFKDCRACENVGSLYK